MSKPVVAIQPDNQGLTSGRRQSFSDRWHELASEQGIEARPVDVYSPDFFEQLQGCDAFMWWFAQPPRASRPGRRVIAALEHNRTIATFPDVRTIWHFDDKIAQYYLLRANDIPVPRTWVLWSLRKAMDFLASAEYPLVLKLASGIVSQNVRLLRDPEEARYYARLLFGPGMYRLPTPASAPRRAARTMKRALRMLLNKPISELEDLQNLYMLLQEFLPGNAFDTRITVIGNRAFALRRHNRPGDFRASGSGLIDWDPSPIPEDAIRLAFRVATTLRSQSLAVDVLRHEGEPVIGEVSYYYEGWAVTASPGHWELQGDADTGQLVWVDGAVRPEDAIWADFLARLAAPVG